MRAICKLLHNAKQEHQGVVSRVFLFLDGVELFWYSWEGT